MDAAVLGLTARPWAAGARSPTANRRLAWVLLFVTPALWSVNYLVARWAPAHIGPHLLAFGRWLLAAALLAALVAPELWRQRALLRAQAGRFLVLGALGMWICGAWVYIAGRSTSATNIALIYAASPVLIALLSVALLREALGRWQALGFALALAGVVHVVVRGQWSALGAVQWVPGDAWIVAATVAWAGYALLQRRWPMPLSGAAYLCAAAIGGLVVLLPFTAWEVAQTAQAGQPVLTPTGLVLIVLAAVFPGAAAFWCYAHVQQHLGVARAGLQLYLGPLYGGLMAWLVLGEAPGWHHAAGAALILSGVWLAGRRPGA